MNIVAITGAGLITPFGAGVDATQKGIQTNRIAVAEPTGEGPPCMECVGRAPSELESFPPKLQGQVRFLNRGAHLGYNAALEAIGQAGDPQALSSRRSLYLATGDLTGVGCRPLKPAITAAAGKGFDQLDRPTLNRSAIEQVNPFFLLETLYNNPYSFVSAAFDCMGPGTSLASDSPCGNQAVELAARNIQEDRADVALVVGCGSWVSKTPLFELEGIGLLSSAHRGNRSFRPFDARRDGFLAAEGGAALVLEPLPRALQRGAEVLGTIEGSGSASQPGLSVPAKVTLRSMEIAVAEGAKKITDLAFICCHGSATRKGDKSELDALVSLLGSSRQHIPLCALKPYTGHMGAASDIAEIIVGLGAASCGVVPGTPNLERLESDFSDLILSNQPRATTGTRFLYAAYGLAGQSCSVLINAGHDGQSIGTGTQKATGRPAGKKSLLQASGFRKHKALLELRPETCSLRPET